MNIYIKVHHALVANEFVLILWHTGTWGDSLNCLSTGTWGVFLEVRFPLVAQGICWTHNTTLLHQIQKRMKFYHFQCHNDMWYVTIILQEFKKRLTKYKENNLWRDFIAMEAAIFTIQWKMCTMVSKCCTRLEGESGGTVCNVQWTIFFFIYPLSDHHHHSHHLLRGCYWWVKVKLQVAMGVVG